MCRRRVDSRPGSGRPHHKITVRRLVPVLALAVGLAIPATVARAQDGGDQRQQLQDQIGEASAQETAALKELWTIRAKKGAIDARVREIDAQVSAAEAKLVPLQAEGERLAAALEQVQGELARAQVKLDRAQRRLDASAAELYRSSRAGAAYEMALSSPPEDVIRTDRYLDKISERRGKILHRVEALRDEVERRRRETAEQKAAADTVEAQAQAERDRVAQLRQEIEPARAEAAQQEAAEQQALDAIQAQKAQYEAEWNALQAASDYVSSLLRARGSGGGAAAPCEARPVPGAITSGFGMRYHPILHYYRMHTGVDMAAAYGEPIHACRGGTVVLAGPNGGYGNCVVIDHGGGMATLYAHQSRLAVSVGDHVDAGDVIGYVGSSGMSTGPHLHFEVRLSGNPVDPAPYL
jgi:murein DD-endopeptidase MepM/ murein hydrolase activator NlpD